VTGLHTTIAASHPALGIVATGDICFAAARRNCPRPRRRPRISRPTRPPRPPSTDRRRFPGIRGDARIPRATSSASTPRSVFLPELARRCSPASRSGGDRSGRQGELPV